MGEHTPLPWTTHPDETGDWIVDADRDHRVAFVGHVSSPRTSADAAYIVAACNVHDDLVAALTRIIEHGFSAQAEEQARAALAKAWEGWR